METDVVCVAYSESRDSFQLVTSLVSETEDLTRVSDTQVIPSSLIFLICSSQAFLQVLIDILSKNSLTLDSNFH